MPEKTHSHTLSLFSHHCKPPKQVTGITFDYRLLIALFIGDSAASIDNRYVKQETNPEAPLPCATGSPALLANCHQGTKLAHAAMRKWTVMTTDHTQRRAKRDIAKHVYDTKMLAEGLCTCHEFMALVKSIKVLGGAVLKTPLRVPFLAWKKSSNADGQKLEPPEFCEGDL